MSGSNEPAESVAGSGAAPALADSASAAAPPPSGAAAATGEAALPPEAPTPPPEADQPPAEALALPDGETAAMPAEAPAAAPAPAAPTGQGRRRRALVALGQLLMLLAVAATMLGAMPGGLAGALAMWSGAAIPFALGAFVALAAGRPAARPLSAARRVLALAGIAAMLAGIGLSLLLAGGGGPGADRLPELDGMLAGIEGAIAAMIAAGLGLWWWASRTRRVLREPMRPLRMALASFAGVAAGAAAVALLALPRLPALPAEAVAMLLQLSGAALGVALLGLLLALLAGRAAIVPAAAGSAPLAEEPPPRRAVGFALYALGGLLIAASVAALGFAGGVFAAFPAAELRQAAAGAAAAAPVLLALGWFTFWLAATR